MEDEQDDQSADQPLSFSNEEHAASWAEHQARREADQHPDTEAVMAYLNELDRGFEELLETFPEEERGEAARGVYIDGDGNAATHYGRLRPL